MIDASGKPAGNFDEGDWIGWFDPDEFALLEETK